LAVSITISRQQGQATAEERLRRKQNRNEARRSCYCYRCHFIPGWDALWLRNFIVLYKLIGCKTLYYINTFFSKLCFRNWALTYLGQFLSEWLEFWTECLQQNCLQLHVRIFQSDY